MTRYCANCGAPYEQSTGLCPRCHFDQGTPEGLIDRELAGARPDSPSPAFRYPGEKAALVLATGAALAVTVVLGTVSLGLFVVVVLVSLVSLYVRYVSSQQGMVRVSERSFPAVHRVGKLAAYRLKLPLPPLYVTQDPTYNAYTRGFYRYGFIVLNSELIQDFEPRELLFVIGHEMGHIKRLHTTWLTLLGPAAGGGGNFLLAPLMRGIFNVWSVKAEYTADQGGLIAGGEVEGACLALLKLAGGRTVAREVDLEAIRRAGESGAVSGLVEYLGDHPFIRNRVTHVVNYAASREYRAACWWAQH